MRPKDQPLAARLEAGLLSFERDVRALPGIQHAPVRRVFLEQLVESVHRVRYVSVVKNRLLSPRRVDPADEFFDPLRAAIIKQREGDVEEAFWLVFLFVHFGKNSRGGWRYAREVYGALGGANRWNWANVSSNPTGFREWLREHQDHIERRPPSGGFGNHRKYESLDADSPGGTGAVVASYVRWVGPPRSHQELVNEIVEQTPREPRAAFQRLFESMDQVVHFGRTARFDYLTMLGKLGLAPIEPGSPYIERSTGPARGAQLLFKGANGSPLSVADLNARVVELDSELHVGMQVLEDAVCNWQKSPDEFVGFRG